MDDEQLQSRAESGDSIVSEAIKALIEEWPRQAALCEPRRGIPNFDRDPQRFSVLTRCARELEAALMTEKPPHG